MTAQPRPAPAPALRLVPQPRAAIYARVSDPKQEANYSLPTQEAAMRAYCAEHGYALDEAHVYREVHTGTELWERPALAEVRAALDRRELDVLVCYDPDRFSRKQVHSALLQDMCERSGAELRFARFDFTKDATGQFLLNARVFAAELEREKILERTMRGKRARAEAGRLLPGRRRTIGAVAEGLNAEGVPTPGGAAIWRHSTVRQIVTHPGYTGTAVAYRFRRSHEPGQRTRLHVRPVEERVTLPEGTIPPLVDAHPAAAVAARLAYNKQAATRNNPDPGAFLLRAGFVSCGYCGGAAAGCWRTTDRWRYPVYCVTHGDRADPCPKISISARELDAAVWRKVEGLLTRPELVAHELERLRQSDPTARDLAAVDASLRAARQRVENLVSTLGLFSDPALAAPVVAEIERAQQHVRALEQERDGILARRGTWEEAERRLDALEEWCRTVAANLGELTYQDKRDALLALGVHVTLYRADHEPHYQITASIPLELPEDAQPDGETARFVYTTP